MKRSYIEEEQKWQYKWPLVGKSLQGDDSEVVPKRQNIVLKAVSSVSLPGTNRRSADELKQK